MKRLLAALSLGIVAAAIPALAAKPSFDCAKAEGAAEKLICQDDELAKLDVQMAAVYKASLAKASGDMVRLLKAEQRGWIKGRDESWKENDARAYLKSQYETRISELQALYRLVNSRGPFFWACDGNPANEVVVTFFDSLLPTARAEHGDKTVTLFVSPSGSGAKYEGQNVLYWEHQGEAEITWGYGEKAMKCKPQR